MLHGYLDLPTFTFFNEKNIWTGSVFQDFNFKIFLKTEDDKQSLCALTWLGRKCFDLIKPDEFTNELYEEFSPEGLEIIIAKLNELVEQFKQSHA